MKAYLSIFQLRFYCGIQYRAAAVAGVVTQFTWGFMQILLYLAFYDANPGNFPMGFSQTASYFWLQQAFMNLFMTWFVDNDILNAITTGGIAYELCRPIDLYNMWFTKSMSNRLSKAILRAVPILVISAMLPSPFGLTMPASFSTLIFFLLSLFLGFFIVVAFTMLIYAITFFSLSPIGIRIVSLSVMEFLSGGIIPLPFLPKSILRIVEILPFASMQNVPYRLFSGDFRGAEVLVRIGLQIFWLVVLVIIGRILMQYAVKKAVVQGG